MEKARKKSLTHAHMAFAISIVSAGSAIPVYLPARAILALRRALCYRPGLPANPPPSARQVRDT